MKPTGGVSDAQSYDDLGRRRGSSAKTLPAVPEGRDDDADFVVAADPPACLGAHARYRIDGEIARGGMGVILRAQDMQLERTVAVKLLHHAYQGSAKLHEQFVAEARITGRLQHPGIVPIYEMGTAPDGRPYFVMEYVEGQTLAARLAARRDYHEDLPRLMKVFDQICQTLSYVHSRGVVHLDLKPSNVMVGAFGQVYLMDWGVARLWSDAGHRHRPRDPHPPPAHDTSGDPAAHDPAIRDPAAHDSAIHDSAIHDSAIHDPVAGAAAAEVWRLPQRTQEMAAAYAAGQRPPLVRGTPEYMPPEQARGESVDVRSDVFGLGAMLCEILTGRPPYRGTDVRQVYRRAVQASLQRTFWRLDRCNAHHLLVRLAKRSLSPNPDDRPADARVVAQQVTAYLDDMLEQTQHDWRRFFELSQDLFCIASLDGYFRRVNANFSRVLGYSVGELVSRPFLDFVHPADRKRTVAVMQRLAEGMPVVRFQNRYRDVAGRYHCLEWTAKSVLDEGSIFAMARLCNEPATESDQQP